jgi:pimeloyl-ACP methyl ester carboxylesterase
MIIKATYFSIIGRTRMSRFQLSRRRVAGTIAIGGILIAAVAAGGPALASSARATPVVAKASTGSKPTVVLVHGAWANSASWNGVISRLQNDGYPVVAPPTLLRSLASDVTHLQAYLSTVSGPVILVGHSYGGSVISNAAVGNQNVKALVYVDAFAPDKGESTGDLSGDTALTDSVFTVVPAGAPTLTPDLYVPAGVFASALANDLPARTAKVLAANQSPANVAAVTDPSGEPAWKTVPSWYLVGTLDKAIPKAAQLTMAKRAKSHIVEVPASHLSIISQPSSVEHLIEAADRGTR